KRMAGPLTRDETATVRRAALYAQGDWKSAPRWSASAGLRHTEVSFYSADYFIVPGTANGDESGQIRFKNTSPVAGLVYEASPSLNFYGNVGKGFETPNFAELAYQNNNVPGLNFAMEHSNSLNTDLLP